MLHRIRRRFLECEPAPRESVYGANVLSETKDRLDVLDRWLGIDWVVRVQERGPPVRPPIRRALRRWDGQDAGRADPVFGSDSARVRP